MCVVSIQDVRDRRSTDERAKTSGIKIENNSVENGALGYYAVDGGNCLEDPYSR